ncbi:MAG: NADH:flavin oxidoreductase [Halieaceae bacterium]|jgi:2,4-dienoyl-CoA reductase-like NADH-dependent reductase (Old Yellow Enzyme family)|nr:NADH:flavin oxidoreductase [Halieaceae bacterium]
MWKPPQRIKYSPLSETWPDREQSAGSRLFSPVEVGPLTLEQRSWVPAMVPWRASEDGEVTGDVLDWYGRFARGRPGAIVVEATGIRDVPSGPLLRIGHDRFLPGLRQLVDRVKAESGGHTRLLIQIIDFLGIRRRPEREKYLRRFLQITDRHRRLLGDAAAGDEVVRERLCALDDDLLAGVLDAREWEALTMGQRERVTDTGSPHIAQLPRVLPGLFADAARRARTAGFDGVELHYAHAYTMASFLSATNTREDGYGGSLENRLRLPLEVVAAVRQAVGRDFALGCRYLADECIEHGNGVAEAMRIGVALAGAGMDFLSLSRGGKFDDARQPKVGEAAYPYTGVSGYECMPGYLSDEFGPYGRNVEATTAIRQAVRGAGYETPIVVAGGIHTFTQAETLLRQERADIVAFARQALADPDWFEKVRSGCGGQVRRCEYTNYCEGLDQKHKQVTCKLWDRLDLDEPGIGRSRDGRRRLTAPAWKRE